MTNNKQQTPVEWYISKIKEARNFCDDPTMEMDIRHTLEVLIKKGEQAKEMEKERMIEFAQSYAVIHCMGDITKNADEYYNETYGGGNK
jgi:hypothetical protein